jgi:S1-C subfamily serine protease
MRAILIGVVALGSVALAVPAAAQADAPRVERAPPQTRSLPDVIVSRRARLGLKVNLQARETDSVGAYVDLVTPGGPAAGAGLRAGDVITRLDGEALLERPADRGERGRSLPGLRLIRLAARLDPGDTVGLEYRRGGERRTTTLVTDADQLVQLDGRRLPRGMMMRIGPRPAVGVPAFEGRPFELPAPAFELFVAGDLAELELAPLNADLGQYFGTDNGVLVISAPRNSSLGVRGGDVVLAVDGRRPDGPLHLLRILRSYDGGEPFKLDIMRSRKRETLSGSLAAATDER